jgi:hypothetical protein
MPSPNETMELVLRHFPDAKMVEHLPLLQAFVNALMAHSYPIGEWNTEDRIKKYAFSLRFYAELEVIGEWVMANDQSNFIVYSYEYKEEGGE